MIQAMLLHMKWISKKPFSSGTSGNTCWIKTLMLKPILIIATDGGVLENPRYPNTRDVAVDRF